MEPSRKEDEERALAFAALALVKGAIDALEQEGVLKDGVQPIFERALASLEFRAQDGATGLAPADRRGHPDHPRRPAPLKS